MKTGISDADITQKLESDVAGRLASLSSSTEDTATGEAAVLADKSTPDPDENAQKPQVVTQPAKTVPVVAQPAQTSKPEAGAQKTTVDQTTTSENEPTLPDAYRRAAIHQQWSEEQVKDFWDADPIRALQTFKQIHESNNTLSKTFSEFGQIKRRLEEQAVVQAAPIAPVAPVVTQPAVSIDIAGLKKQYGDDPLVNIVEQLATKVNELSTPAVTAQPVPPVQAAPIFQPVVPTQNALQEVNSFFASDELKVYRDFYGTGDNYDALTPGEFANRYQVGQTAGTIIAGAELKGERMPVGEALQRAHMIHSQPYLEKAIIADIQNQLKTRSANLTVKPGAAPGSAIQPAGKPANRTEVEQRAADRMAKIGLYST